MKVKNFIIFLLLLFFPWMAGSLFAQGGVTTPAALTITPPAFLFDLNNAPGNSPTLATNVVFRVGGSPQPSVVTLGTPSPTPPQGIVFPRQISFVGNASGSSTQTISITRAAAASINTTTVIPLLPKKGGAKPAEPPADKK